MGNQCSVNVIITDSASLWCFAAPKVGALGETQCEAKTQSIRFAYGASFGQFLVERCTNSRRPEATTVAGHHRDARRVSLSTLTDSVAPLDKGVALACEERLAVNVDKLTELAIITLTEHYYG